MKLTHKIGRPGYKNGINMSPLTQRYSNKNMTSINDYKVPIAEYEASRNQQLSTMSQEQLENVKYNDTTLTQPSQWNENQVALSDNVPYGKDVYKVPIYPPKSIATDANYTVTNPVDPSLNREANDPRNASVVSIPGINSFSPGRPKTLLAAPRPAKTSVETFRNADGKQISGFNFDQILRDIEKEKLAQEAYDQDAAQKIATNQ